MSNKNLKNKPHNIKGTENIWWYEEPTGITIVTSYGGTKCEIKVIPWREIRSALKRKDK